MKYRHVALNTSAVGRFGSGVRRAVCNSNLRFARQLGRIYYVANLRGTIPVWEALCPGSMDQLTESPLVTRTPEISRSKGTSMAGPSRGHMDLQEGRLKLRQRG